MADVICKEKQNDRKRSLKLWKRFAILAIVLMAFLLLFTPLNISQFRLNALQRQNLCEALADDFEWEDREFINSAVASSLDIFGISGFGNKMTVYAYLSEGLYIEAKGKGYEISGGLSEIMADIKVKGDNVEIVKKYGDGVSTMETLSEMPLRYRCKWGIYTSLNLEQVLHLRTNGIAEEKLGVPVDSQNTLSIDQERGIYMIYDWDIVKNEEIVKYEGNSSELLK